MDGLSTKSKIHLRLSTFVQWIAPEPGTRDDIINQSDDIRKRISDKAEEDGLIVVSTLRAGSFAKKTGLRRHMRGESEVEGQDIDLSFIVKPTEENNYQPIINKFLKYAEQSFPKTERKTTKSSVELIFTSTLSYDLVPLYATKDPDKQILVRTTGEQIATSVQKHTEFITNRTEKSEGIKGVVTFNECVRLFKWWRDVRCANANYLQKVPSIIIDLLCAKAFDKLSVQTTYSQTLAEWCTFLAHIVTKREPIIFTDYNNVTTSNKVDAWQVIDPINPENNIARKLQPYEIDELADWLRIARDDWNRAIANDLKREDNQCLENLVSLFGNAFKNHCGE